jgi:hypothetical protein
MRSEDTTECRNARQNNPRPECKNVDARQSSYELTWSSKVDEGPLTTRKSANILTAFGKCSIPSGKAAAKYDRAKLLAASADAAYTGYCSAKSKSVPRELVRYRYNSLLRPKT